MGSNMVFIPKYLVLVTLNMPPPFPMSLNVNWEPKIETKMLTHKMLDWARCVISESSQLETIIFVYS